MVLRLFGALAHIMTVVLLTISSYLTFGLLGAGIVLAICVGIMVLGTLYRYKRMQRG